MTDLPFEGALARGFEPVRDEFALLFAENLERGGSVCVMVDGEVVVDLVAGWSDRAATLPFTPDNLTPVYSCSKAVSSLVIAWLVEQGVLSYDMQVAEVWPEFAQAGKGEVTLAQMLSHQAGLCCMQSPWAPEDWFDWDKTCERLAGMEPMWELGDGSGYHPVTWGYLAGEVVQRASGRTIGAILREEFCAPNDLDFWIGLPDSEHARVAQTSKPTKLPNFGHVNEFQKLAFMKVWSSPGRRGGAAWRRMEIPSANGHGTAHAMAGLMSLLATGGKLGGKQMLSAATIRAATCERVSGLDRVLPADLSFGAGFIRNTEHRPVYGPGLRTVGHTGFGGSVLFADIQRRVSFGYVTTKQENELVQDMRAGRLIRALYGCL